MVTDRQTDTHTQTKYCNPHCTCALRFKEILQFAHHLPTADFSPVLGHTWLLSGPVSRGHMPVCLDFSSCLAPTSPAAHVRNSSCHAHRAAQRRRTRYSPQRRLQGLLEWFNQPVRLGMVRTGIYRWHKLTGASGAGLKVGALISPDFLRNYPYQTLGVPTFDRVPHPL